MGYAANWIQYVASGTIPVIPGTPTASDGTFSDRVRVTWSAVTGATHYQVYRATSATDTPSLLASPTATSYDDLGAVTGTTYYYWLKACNSAGCSGFSGYDTGYRAAAARPDLIVTTVSGPTTIAIDVMQQRCRFKLVLCTMSCHALIGSSSRGRC